MKNKKNLIFISLGVVILLTTIFLSYILYQRNMNNKINNFSSYISEYKQEISNYYLSDNQKNYDNLIAEAEQAIDDKDYKKISSLTSSLSEFKEKILAENNDSLSNFSNYINTYKEEITNYNLDDSKEKYDSLISEAEQTVTNKNYKNIESITFNLNQFKEELLNKNVEVINNTITELESIDISKILDKESIINKIEEIKKLKDEKQFIKAVELSKTLKEDINNKLEVIKQEENKINEIFSNNISLIEYALPDFTIKEIFPVEKIETKEFVYPYDFIRNDSITDVFEVNYGNKYTFIAYIYPKDNSIRIDVLLKEMLCMGGVADSFFRKIDKDGTVTGTRMASNSNIMAGEVPIETFR